MRRVVGIDLGTTHCAVAASPADRAEVRLFPVPQLVAPGEVAPRRLLPSALYLPAEGEFAPGDLALPWGEARPMVGEAALARGARVPQRLVVSAKSWLVHGGVNRRAAVLPWSAPDDAPKLSPFDATARILEHLRAAWDHAHPDAPLAEQDVVITVPASFDAVARELTVEAARAAGLAEPALLEEPQAAFYDFLGNHEGRLGEVLGAARVVLVVDVGGGTTDLTLVRVTPPAEEGGEPGFERIAVGGHLLLGGDNMDAALAHRAREAAGVGELDPTEWGRLVQAARAAKEALLGEKPPEQVIVAVQRRGSRLVGGTRSVPLRRDEVERVVLDGFFPLTDPGERPARRGRAALTTLGLPYASDPAVPRHVAGFLARHAAEAREAGARVVAGLARPDAVLLNGGVFNGAALVRRLDAVFARWFGEPVPLLAHGSLDTAVARGAARFALARRGLGTAITGGAGRAWYVGVAGPGGANRAICVVPRGLDEGATVDLRDRPLELVLGTPVRFPLYASTGGHPDEPGAIIEVDDELERLPAVRTALRPPERGMEPGQAVPVWLSAHLSEQGVLGLSLVTVALPPVRWRLAFDLSGEDAEAREGAAGEAGAGKGGGAEKGAAPAPRLDEALAHLDRALRPGSARPAPRPGRRAKGPPPRTGGAKALRKDLERILGPRGDWTLPTCRALFDALWERREARARGLAHERSWLRLAGWGLRPGVGAPGDAERVGRAWALWSEGLRHGGDKGERKLLWADWWVFWRRLAAGLDADRQAAVRDAVLPWLGDRFPAGPRRHGPAEMVRLLAVLERLPPDDKLRAAEAFRRHRRKVGSWWPLGRLGARVPVHGPVSATVPAEVAEEWLVELLDLDWEAEEGAAFAAVLLARRTGDPARDLPEALAKKTAKRLRRHGAPERWIRVVREVADLDASDAGALVGEALPPGLRLLG